MASTSKGTGTRHKAKDQPPLQLTRDQADALCVLLDVATEEGWPHTVRRLKERGIDIQVLRLAWGILETTAGVDGGVPDLADFDQ